MCTLPGYRQKLKPVHSLISKLARVKIKALDAKQVRFWIMKLNAKQHVEPYHTLNV